MKALAYAIVVTGFAVCSAWLAINDRGGKWMGTAKHFNTTYLYT